MNGIRDGGGQQIELGDLTIVTHNPIRALEWLDDWAVDIEFHDGDTISGVFHDISDDSSPLREQLFAITPVLEPQREILRGFVGNIAKVTVI